MAYASPRLAAAANSQRGMRRAKRILWVLLVGVSMAATARAASVQIASVPVSMRECENETHSCGAWIFSDRQGSGMWYDGSHAQLAVELFDGTHIVVTRRDFDGNAPGLTARYEGIVQGNRIEGTVVWSWPAAWGSRTPSGKWNATFEHISADEALARSKKAWALHDEIEARRWQVEAAKGGNQEAKDAIKTAMAAKPPPNDADSPAARNLRATLRSMFTPEYMDQMMQKKVQQNAECERSPECKAEAGKRAQAAQDIRDKADAEASAREADAAAAHAHEMAVDTIENSSRP